MFLPSDIMNLMTSYLTRFEKVCLHMSDLGWRYNPQPGAYLISDDSRKKVFRVISNSYKSFVIGQVDWRRAAANLRELAIQSTAELIERSHITDWIRLKKSQMGIYRYGRHLKLVDCNIKTVKLTIMDYLFP